MNQRAHLFPDGGFTLIEFLVVFVVLTTLTAVTYPRLAALADIYRLDGAARNLAIDLQKTRGRAIAEGKCFRVNFDASARTYQIQSKSGETPCGTTGFVDEGPARRLEDSASIAFSLPDNPGSDPVSPIFETRGRCSAPSAIRVFNSSNAARVVLVQSTGRIHVQ